MLGFGALGEFALGEFIPVLDIETSDTVALLVTEGDVHIGPIAGDALVVILSEQIAILANAAAIDPVLPECNEAPAVIAATRAAIDELTARLEYAGAAIELSSTDSPGLRAVDLAALFTPAVRGQVGVVPREDRDVAVQADNAKRTYRRKPL